MDAEHATLAGGTGAGAAAAMERTDSRVVYRTDWMTVREDSFRRPDGTTGTYGVVDKRDFAIVVPEQDGFYHLVEQFRYPLGRRSWEFPMGGWPAGVTGSQAELAAAELAEETGLRAATWTHLGRCHEAGGFCTQGFDAFHATDLTPGQPHREDSEADMVHKIFSDRELRRMITGGVIFDGATIAAFALLLLRA